MLEYQEKNMLCYNERMSDLFSTWRKKSEIGINGKLMSRRLFYEDGIVDYQQWSALPEGKRMLFVLKEINDKTQTQDWTIQELLKEDATYRMWRRVAEWTKGIIDTNGDGLIIPYAEIPDSNNRMEWLRCIAVINLKKAPGIGKADKKAIEQYATTDADEIRKEIEIIDPDLIILGGTKHAFSMVCDVRQLGEQRKYLYANICGRKRQIIDYYHPAYFRSKKKLYDGIMEIYLELLNLVEPK